MANPRHTPLLHRDDPDKAPLVGNVKVTREDWLNAAQDVLIADGVAHVKVLALAERMGVSRSSFYWYFKSRRELLDALLETWQQTNTAALVAQANAPAERITGAVANVFKCFLSPANFNNPLDFAVRDWARKSPEVRRILDASDARRLGALQAMFERFGVPEREAQVRAKTLYYMQIGYNDADVQETIANRLSFVGLYMEIFTGRKPDPSDIQLLYDYAHAEGVLPSETAS